MKKMIPIKVFAIFCFMYTGCVSSHWNGQVSRWGTLREVLHEGQSQGRVRLSEVAQKSNAYGVGAVEGLTGEILILDGRVWISECENSQKLNTYDQPDGNTKATLLAMSYVPSWKIVPLDHTVTNEEFEKMILETANQYGLSDQQVFPFMVKGDFQQLSVHVMNGQCPMMTMKGGDSPGHQPYRNELHDISATLVGFYGKNQAGILMHHDSNIHVHALIDHGSKIVGHVDVLDIKPGAVLYLPDR